MVYIENGTYTAVRRRALHHCTRSPPEAMTLPNWSVLSAASCTYGLANATMVTRTLPIVTLHVRYLSC